MAGVARIANTGTVHARAVVVALVGTLGFLTSVAHPTLRALAAAVALAGTMAGAGVRAPLDITAGANIFSAFAHTASAVAVSVDAVNTDLASLVGASDRGHGRGCVNVGNNPETGILAFVGVRCDIDRCLSLCEVGGFNGAI